MTTKFARTRLVQRLARFLDSGGIYVGNVRELGDIQINYCSFVPLNNTSLGRQALPLGQVNPILFSEVMRDLTNLTAKTTQ